jgi:hypothetical protein
MSGERDENEASCEESEDSSDVNKVNNKKSPPSKANVKSKCNNFLNLNI